MRDAPQSRYVLGQAEMTTIVMVIRQVRTNELPEVSVAQDDHVLEQLPPTAPDPSLRHRILPGTALWLRKNAIHRFTLSDSTGRRGI